MAVKKIGEQYRCTVCGSGQLTANRHYDTVLRCSFVDTRILISPTAFLSDDKAAVRAMVNVEKGSNTAILGGRGHQIHSGAHSAPETAQGG